MSRFRRLSHTIWHCQYHVVWVPKYRYRILTGSVKQAAEDGVQAICGYAGCEVVELNVQPDHVHLVLMIPPKVAVSDLLCVDTVSNHDYWLKIQKDRSSNGNRPDTLQALFQQNGA